MADFSGILSQLNGLRTGYGGQALPNAQAPQPRTLNFQVPPGMPFGQRSIPQVTNAANPSFYDPAAYTQPAKSWPENMPMPQGTQLGGMSSKMGPMLGLLPQGTNLGDQSIFGSLNPMNGWAPKDREVANAWTQTGQVPIEQFGQSMNPEMLAKITRKMGGDPSAMWNRYGQQFVQAAANPWTDPRLDRMARTIDGSL
jgi:hypothetical protein